MFFAKTTVSAALVAAVSAHIKMSSPAPFNPQSLDNGPLLADGSDFPCKMSAKYALTGGETNTFELGSSQKLAFVGSAVHGGGSCQVSITYDNPPTKDSKWKVIHSIEGGCPARDTPANLPENANLETPFTYDYTVPSDLPAGSATIAWTWFNRVGNREMYMNCGSLELTGSGGDQSSFDSLPDMVIMNVPGHQGNFEGVDYAFADPGKSVEVNNELVGLQVCGNDGCQQPEATAKLSGPAAGSNPDPSSPATTSAPAAPSSSAPGGVFITVPGGGSSAQPTVTAGPEEPTSTAVPEQPTPAPETVVVPSAPVATSSPVAEPTSTPQTPPSGGSGGSCTEGAWKCVDGKSFQRCASGSWSAVMQLAAGTSCTLGEGADLKMVAGKRAIRAFRA